MTRSSSTRLDSTPVGILCHPRNPPHARDRRKWLADPVTAGRRVVLPEVVDYEVRRELLRRKSRVALAHLDVLNARLEYAALTTAAMRLPASLWAQARAAGQPTAAGEALDADVILAAQAVCLNAPVIVATGNPAHLTRYVPADLWSNIRP